MFKCKMYYGKICVLLLVLIPATFADTDYCDANLCYTGEKHIGCGNSGNYSRACDTPQLIYMTNAYRKLIIGKHNSLRSKIARGFKDFPPAKRMATMVWDDELAKLAELNVKQCKMRRDQCRNTPKFSFVGQNVAIKGWSGLNFNVSEVIYTQIQIWFNEYKVCPWDVINSYKPSYRLSYDRFTTMVQDKSTRVGCAILRNISEDSIEQIMACNYAYDNILGDPVYISGKTASLCTTGNNKIFTSLCSVREKYN